MPDIDPRALNAAARIYVNGDMSCDFEGDGQYEGFTDEQREYAQTLVRSMVEAAAPFIRAQALHDAANKIDHDQQVAGSRVLTVSSGYIRDLARRAEREARP